MKDLVGMIPGASKAMKDVEIEDASNIEANPSFQRQLKENLL
jgi:hypothetical protein